MKKYIETYVNYMLSEGRDFNKTLNKYIQCIEESLVYLNIESLEDINELNYITVREKWLLVKRDEGLGSQSLNVRITALKSFLGFLKGMRYIDYNVAEDLKRFKVENKVAKQLDEIERDGLTILSVAEEECRKNPNYLTIRNNFLLNLLASTGLRNSEARELQLTDISVTDGKFTVVGKYSKERVLYLNEYVLDMYREYLKYRHKVDTEDTHLFVSKLGKILNKNEIGRIINKFKDIANIESDFHPHSCRHLFASELLQSGVDIVVVAKALGHSNIAVTYATYTHTSEDEIRNAVNSNIMFKRNKNNIKRDLA